MTYSIPYNRKDDPTEYAVDFGWRGRRWTMSERRSGDMSWYFCGELTPEGKTIVLRHFHVPRAATNGIERLARLSPRQLKTLAEKVSA